MADQQAPERIWITGTSKCGAWNVKPNPNPSLHEHEKPYVPLDLLEAAERRAEQAEAERDQALAASAAREIAMRDRAADGSSKRYKHWKQGGPVECDFTACKDIADAIRALPLSPDGQQALNEMLADAWDGGCSAAYSGLEEIHNPYRKATT